MPLVKINPPHELVTSGDERGARGDEKAITTVEEWLEKHKMYLENGSIIFPNEAKLEIDFSSTEEKFPETILENLTILGLPHGNLSRKNVEDAYKEGKNEPKNKENPDYDKAIVELRQFFRLRNARSFCESLNKDQQQSIFRLLDTASIHSAAAGPAQDILTGVGLMFNSAEAEVVKSIEVLPFSPSDPIQVDVHMRGSAGTSNAIVEKSIKDKPKPLADIRSKAKLEDNGIVISDISLEVVGPSELVDLLEKNSETQPHQIIQEDQIYFETLKQYALQALKSEEDLTRLFNAADGDWNTRLLGDHYLLIQGKTLLPPHIVSHIDQFEHYLSVAGRPTVTSMLYWVRDLIQPVSDFFELFLQDADVKSAITKRKSRGKTYGTLDNKVFDYRLVLSIFQLIADAVENKLRGNYPNHSSILGVFFQHLLIQSPYAVFSGWRENIDRRTYLRGLTQETKSFDNSLLQEFRATLNHVLQGIEPRQVGRKNIYRSIHQVVIDSPEVVKNQILLQLDDLSYPIYSIIRAYHALNRDVSGVYKPLLQDEEFQQGLVAKIDFKKPMIASRVVTFLTHVGIINLPIEYKYEPPQRENILLLRIQQAVDTYLRDVAGEVENFEEYLAKKPWRIRQNVKTAFQMKGIIHDALQSEEIKDKEAAVKNILKLADQARDRDSLGVSKLYREIYKVMFKVPFKRNSNPGKRVTFAIEAANRALQSTIDAQKDKKMEDVPSSLETLLQNLNDAKQRYDNYRKKRGFFTHENEEIASQIQNIIDDARKPEATQKDKEAAIRYIYALKNRARSNDSWGGLFRSVLGKGGSRLYREIDAVMHVLPSFVPSPNSAQGESELEKKYKSLLTPKPLFRVVEDPNLSEINTAMKHAFDKSGNTINQDAEKSTPRSRASSTASEWGLNGLFASSTEDNSSGSRTPDSSCSGSDSPDSNMSVEERRMARFENNQDAEEETPDQTHLRTPSGQ